MYDVYGKVMENVRLNGISGKAGYTKTAALIKNIETRLIKNMQTRQVLKRTVKIIIPRPIAKRIHQQNTITAVAIPVKILIK